jgi:hypothetical protein
MYGLGSMCHTYTLSDVYVSNTIRKCHPLGRDLISGLVGFLRLKPKVTVKV